MCNTYYKFITKMSKTGTFWKVVLTKLLLSFTFANLRNVISISGWTNVRSCGKTSRSADKLKMHFIIHKVNNTSWTDDRNNVQQNSHSGPLSPDNAAECRRPLTSVNKCRKGERVNSNNTNTNTSVEMGIQKNKSEPWSKNTLVTF